MFLCIFIKKILMKIEIKEQTHLELSSLFSQKDAIERAISSIANAYLDASDVEFKGKPINIDLQNKQIIIE